MGAGVSRLIGPDDFPPEAFDLRAMAMLGADPPGEKELFFNGDQSIRDMTLANGGNSVRWFTACDGAIFSAYQKPVTGSGFYESPAPCGPFEIRSELVPADGTYTITTAGSVSGPEGELTTTDSPTTASLLPTAISENYFFWAENLLASEVTAFAVAEAGTAWFAQINGSGDVEIRATDTASPDAGFRWWTVENDGAPLLIDSMVASPDGLSVFWHEKRGGTGPIQRLELEGVPSVGALTTNVSSPASPLDLEANATHLYWVDGTDICRITFDAATVERDLEALALEVIQVVQQPDNSVPLITGKDTVVRFFARIAESSLGESELTGPPSLARLHGSDGDGNPLPGSPLVARSPVPSITSAALDRHDPSQGFQFRLPDSWVAMSGDLTLRAEINPDRLHDETDFSNNEVTETVELRSKAPICLFVQPLQLPGGNSGQGWRPEFEGQFARAEAMLPTPEVRAYFEGGRPMSELQATNRFPFITTGPYEMRSGNDEKNRILLKLELRGLRRGPEWCRELNARVHHTAMIERWHTEWPFNGYADGGLTGLGRALIRTTGDLMSYSPWRWTSE